MFSGFQLSLVFIRNTLGKSCHVTHDCCKETQTQLKARTGGRVLEIHAVGTGRLIDAFLWIVQDVNRIWLVA